jgi:hypothetical protein
MPNPDQPSPKQPDSEIDRLKKEIEARFGEGWSIVAFATDENSDDSFNSCQFDGS